MENTALSPEEKVMFWHEPEARARLHAAQFSLDFYTLAPLFERQQKPTYCGVASAVMVLNALRLHKGGLNLEESLDVEIPESHGGGKMRYNAYSQLTFFDKIDVVKAKQRVEGICKESDFDPGFCLTMLAQQLRAHLTQVEICVADENSDARLARFRHDLMAFLNDRTHYVILNFHGKSLGLSTGGHFSPVAAYDSATDSALVMDVCGHKYPWFWVKISDLFAAMHTQDNEGWRGYLVVKDKL